jgi:catechol 2,3-dioxygenase-like lactoylglutathione lyase family enzyme
MIHAMNHFTITAEDRSKTLAFYCDLLGLQQGHRPDLGFPGAWLYAGGEQAVLHIYWDRPMPTQRTGVIDHMAFSARGLREVKARFDAASVKYDLRQQAGSGTWQLFSFDPNGARVELDFEASETL